MNPDVTIVINATHTDVDIETWNKNEVSIEAVIEVEGVSKKEAEKIVKHEKQNGAKIEGSIFDLEGDGKHPKFQKSERIEQFKQKRFRHFK